MLMAIACTVGFFLFLVYKVNYIIDTLKLDKGFDTEKTELSNNTGSDISILKLSFNC